MFLMSLSRATFGCALMASSMFLLFPAAHAQSAGNGGWFVPKSAHPEAAPTHPVARRVPVQEPTEGEEGPEQGAQQPQTPPVLPLPPIPTPPGIPKASPPPSAIIGIINVQGVMQFSSAAQEIQQVLGARRDKLAQAVQREEAAWRAEQQKLQSEARNLTSEQIQLRERHLQERRARDQHDFGNQARVIQEAAQVAFHQIERELEEPNGIIAQVAASHSMNLIMHAEQVVLHVGGQDITEEVATRLNKTLPHVFIPGEGVDPEQLAKSGKMPTTADEERLAHEAPAPQTASGQPSTQPQSVLRQHP